MAPPFGLPVAGGWLDIDAAAVRIVDDAAARVVPARSREASHLPASEGVLRLRHNPRLRRAPNAQAVLRGFQPSANRPPTPWAAMAVETRAEKSLAILPSDAPCRTAGFVRGSV